MRYTQEQLDFLREGYLKMRIPALAEAFNVAFGLCVSQKALKSTLKNHWYTCGRPAGNRKGERLEYTQEHIEFLREHYPAMSRKELTSAFNERFGKAKTVDQVVSFCKRAKITSGRTGYFDKGQQPWNAGTKGLMKPNSGTFRPGNIPGNLREMGAERFDKEGYLEVKIEEANPYTGAPTRFKHKHVAMWEAAHGPTPRGFKVRFIDGDRLNCALENLEMVSAAEHLRLNQIGYADVDSKLKPLMRSIAALEVKTFQRRRGDHA